MNLGILTFSDFNTNYGSMLQALSMKLYLEKNGHQVTFIRYREYNKPFQPSGAKAKILLTAKKIILNLYARIHANDIKKSQKNFDQFRMDYFSFTPLYKSNDELKNMKEKFDAVICGSDQLWNLNCLGGLRKPYFLSFVPNNTKKIFYAPSMGEYHFSESDIEIIRPLLERSQAISVREKESIYEIQRICSQKVQHVVDPVFLMSTSEWKNITNRRLIDGDYGICYFVRRSKFGNDIVQKLLNLYKIPIINLSDNMIYINGTESDYISVGPKEFLSILQYAKYAVGTSFHLAAFSIIFDVPVLVCGMESNRSRIMNILEPADLSSHYITPEMYDNRILSDFITELPNHKNIDALTKESKEFLAKQLMNSFDEGEKND